MSGKLKGTTIANGAITALQLDSTINNAINSAALKKLNIATRSNTVSISLSSNATFNVVGRSSNTIISAVF